jgi:RHS repeat-associated protein
MSTQTELANAALNNAKSKGQNTTSEANKNRPKGKEVVNKKKTTIPYGILKNENILKKWTTKKELIANRTSNSKTYLNDDGSKTTLLFFEPIHVDADNSASEKAKYGKNDLTQSSYLEINNNLMSVEAKGKQSFKNTLGLYDVYFPENSSDGIQMNYEDVSLTLYPKDLVWEDMKVEEDQVSIPSKTSGITYVYTVGNTDLKEDIVLNYLTDQESYEYELSVDNGYEVYLDNNIIYVQNKKDDTVSYMLSAPFMKDRDGEVSNNIRLSLEKEKNHYLITVSPNMEWLRDPSRAYPVVIDPTVKISNDSVFRDTYVESKQPDVTQFDSSMLYVGYDDGVRSGNGDYKEGKTNSYIKFQLPNDLTHESTIESATLNLYAYTNWAPTSIVDLKISNEYFKIPSASSPNYTECVTWNTRPALGSTVASTTVTGAGNYSWNLKSVITSWLNGTPNYGLGLQMRNELDQAEVFYSAQGTIKPYVKIVYDNEPEPIPEPESGELELVLERDEIFDLGQAYAKNTLVWDANGESQVGTDGEKTNRATIEYTLMPDGITGIIEEENFTELEWETDYYDLEQDKAYWIEAKVLIEQWVTPEPEEGTEGTGEEASSEPSVEEGTYEELYTETMKTDEFIVTKVQPSDTLKRIAKYYYDDPSKAVDIKELNKLEEDKLYVGQKLFLMTDIEEPLNYDQPEEISSSIRLNDALTGTLSNPIETVGQYINPVTGALSYYHTDVSYPVYSGMVEFTRSYVSTLENRKSPLGDNWDYNYNQYLMFYEDGTIGYNRGDGSRIYYTKAGEEYTTTAPTYDALIVRDMEYAIVTSDKTTYTFNETGLLTEISDKNNNKTLIEYDENDWQSTITDALNQSITIHYYDSDTEWIGNIKEVNLPDSSVLTFTYETDTNLLKEYTDPETHGTGYTYHSDNRLEQVIQGEGNTLFTNQYNDAGKVVEQLDGENKKTSVSYSGTTTTVKDGKELTYLFRFDTKKRVTKKTYPDNTYETFGYNLKGDIVNYRDTLERIHEYTFNDLGYITSYTRPEDNKTYQYEYKDDYLLTRVIDFEGHKTTMTYDTNHNLDKVIEYNTVNGVTEEIVTDYNYATNGLLNGFVDPDGVATTMDNSNYPEKIITTGGGTTSTQYLDTMGRVITYIDGNNNRTDTTYDKNGNILAIVYPSVDGMDRTITYTHDKNGNQLSETGSRFIPDGGGYATTTYTYNDNNQISQVTDPYNDTVTYAYDGNGNMQTITDQEQNVTTYEYDSNNLLKSIYHPGETTPAFTYEYDALGNIKKITEVDGSYTEYEYDYKVGQVSKIREPENYNVSYTYDDMGNVLTETMPDSSTRYVYDDLYQIEKISQSGAAATYVSYTKSGRVSTIKDDKGILYTYHYDTVTGQLLDITEEVTEEFSDVIIPEVNENTISNIVSTNTYLDYTPSRLSYQKLFTETTIETNNTIIAAASLAYIPTISNTLGSILTYKTEYTYDNAGNIKTVKDKAGSLTTYQYNEINEVSQIIDPMNKISYFSYDEDGNVRQTIDGEGNVTNVQYDALNRKYQVAVPEENTTETYLYNSIGLLDKYVDQMGNITAYVYDERGRVKQEIDANQQATIYEYNQDNTLQKIKYPNGELEEYGYDGLDRANWYKDRSGITYDIKYTPSGNTDYISDSVGNKVDYRYDYYGRLTEIEDTIGRVTSYQYDNYSRIISETGNDGNITTYQYDALDRIRKVTDPENKITQVSYNANNNITQIVKPGQRLYTYDYDASGNLSKVTDPLGNATEYRYNNNNEVSDIMNARGFHKTYEYNALNLVKSVTDERNYTTKYDYYPGGLLKSVTDPSNNTTTYAYDAVNQVSSITNALMETTTLGYDFFGNNTSVRDSRGITTTYTYNARNQLEITYDTQNNLTRNEYYANGDLWKTTDPEGYATEYFYDAIHRITKTVDPNGLITNYVYDEVTGDLKRVYDNAGQETIYTYDKMHRLLSETNIQGLVTNYTYDEFGNLKTETTPDGNTTTYTYDELDRITSILDPENNLTALAYDPVGNLDYIIKPTNLKYDYSYDPANNLENIIDPLGQLTTYTYDSNNNISTMLDPAGNTYSYRYDALNRLQTIQDLSGSGSRYDYDTSGNISSILDGNGNLTKYQYNNLNKLEYVEDAEGNVTNYSYYKDGNLQSMTDARGNTSTYTYDAGGNLATFTNPLGEVIQYNYNLLGQVEEEIKADGNTIDYIYDDYNRLESIQYPDQTAVKYTYDEYNRKTSMEDVNGLTEYAYDEMGRLTWVSDPNGEQVSYEYDEKGRKTSVIYPDGKYVDYQYDKYDRIIGVNDREGRIIRYTYDDAGRKKTTTLPNGITTTYEYDKASRITKITSVKEDGTNVLTLSYIYDGAGNRTLEEIWQEEKHYKREYTYYKNNTVKSMQESGDNEVTYTYSYDAAGNIATKEVIETKTVDGQVITTTKEYHYTYDSANRMITETDESGEVRTYRYDANGNRVARVLDADSTVVAESTEEVGSTNATESTGDAVSNTTTEGTVTVEVDADLSTNADALEAAKETADYYYYDYEDRLVEIVLHNGKVFTYGYDGEGNRLWRTYSQYPLVKPPVEEGEQLEDPATFPGYNKDKGNNGNNGNGNGNGKNKTEVLSFGSVFMIPNLGSISITNESESISDTELVTLLSISEEAELVSAVDTYLIDILAATSNNGNSGKNGNGNSNSNNNGNNSTNTNGNNDTTSKGNSGNNSGNNGSSNGNGNGNGNTSSNQTNGNDKANGSNKDKENGNSNSNEWKENSAKVDEEKANGKTKSHSNNGNDKNLNENGNGYAKGKNKNKNKNNNGNHNGWYKNGNSTGNPSDPYDLINPEIFEFTGYINDINQDYTQVLMTTDIDGNYRGVYTYGNGERISVEDLGQVEGVPNDPLYYLSDALGSTVAITNMNAGIIDNNRFAPYGEPLSPVAKNSRLTNNPWGYTGESHDIEAGLVYLRARYYEPGTSRFIQQDSYPYFGEIEEPLTRNLYLYSNGNPLNHTDPSGHIAILPVIIYLAKTAVETIPDVILDYLIEGESFSLWKSAVSNYAFNLIPLFGETKTAKKVAKVAKKYGDNVVTYLTKHGDDLIKHIDELIKKLDNGNINSLINFINKRMDDIVKGTNKLTQIASKYSDNVMKYNYKKGKYIPIKETLQNYKNLDNIAQNMYANFRKITSDIKNIAKNTGWDIKDIEQIKNHIFINKLKLDDGLKILDPDYEIAQAWDRLIKGEYFKNDILLLKHELYELTYYNLYDVTQREAHDAANKVFNWQEYIQSLY